MVYIVNFTVDNVSIDTDCYLPIAYPATCLTICLPDVSVAYTLARVCAARPPRRDPFREPAVARCVAPPHSLASSWPSAAQNIQQDNRRGGVRPVRFWAPYTQDRSPCRHVRTRHGQKSCPALLCPVRARPAPARTVPQQSSLSRERLLRPATWQAARGPRHWHPLSPMYLDRPTGARARLPPARALPWGKPWSRVPCFPSPRLTTRPSPRPLPPALPPFAAEARPRCRRSHAHIVGVPRFPVIPHTCPFSTHSHPLPRHAHTTPPPSLSLAHTRTPSLQNQRRSSIRSESKDVSSLKGKAVAPGSSSRRGALAVGLKQQGSISATAAGNRRSRRQDQQGDTRTREKVRKMHRPRADARSPSEALSRPSPHHRDQTETPHLPLGTTPTLRHPRYPSGSRNTRASSTHAVPWHT